MSETTATTETKATGIFYYNIYTPVKNSNSNKKKNSQRICGCVAIQRLANGNINRGVTLLSNADKWDRKTAHANAKSRVEAAGKAGRSIPFGKYNGKKAGNMPNTPYLYKSEANVAPTAAETKLMEDRIAAKAASIAKRTAKHTA